MAVALAALPAIQICRSATRRCAPPTNRSANRVADTNVLRLYTGYKQTEELFGTF